MAAMKRRLGPLELEVMQLVWVRGTATVRDVWEELYPARKYAYTTIATIFRQVERKGFLSHRKEGRMYVYTPTIDQEEVSRNMLRDLVGSVFNGSAAQLVTTLVQTEELSNDELGCIRAIIDARSGVATHDTM